MKYTAKTVINLAASLFLFAYVVVSALVFGDAAAANREEKARDRRTVDSLVAWDALALPQQRDSFMAWEARRWGAPPELMIAIGRVEDPTGDSTARSPVGAVGIGQVMPAWQHAFEEDCGCRPLIDRRANACRAVHIFLTYRDSLHSVAPTLVAYVGARTKTASGHRAGDAYVRQVFDAYVKVNP